MYKANVARTIPEKGKETKGNHIMPKGHLRMRMGNRGKTLNQKSQNCHSGKSRLNVPNLYLVPGILRSPGNDVSNLSFVTKIKVPLNLSLVVSGICSSQVVYNTKRTGGGFGGGGALPFRYSKSLKSGYKLGLKHPRKEEKNFLIQHGLRTLMIRINVVSYEMAKWLIFYIHVQDTKRLKQAKAVHTQRLTKCYRYTSVNLATYSAVPVIWRRRRDTRFRDGVLIAWASILLLRGAMMPRLSDANNLARFWPEVSPVFISLNSFVEHIENV